MIRQCIANSDGGTCLWCGSDTRPAHVDSETGVAYCVDCCQLCEAKRSKNARVKPLVMGGKTVRSLTGLPEVRFSAREGVEVVDVDTALSIAMAEFDVDEKKFVRGKHIAGLTVEQLAQELAWTMAKARRVQARVQRKIAQAPLSSETLPMLPRASGVTFLERLPSGHQAWGITRPNPDERVSHGSRTRTWP